MKAVGVLTMPGTERVGPELRSYLTYDNYTWLTRAGLRVIPIPVGTTDAEALVYFSQIQGLYLPGGPYDEPTYRRLAVRFLDLASEANRDRPGSFPVWGTCHGFQMMLLWSGVSSLDSLDAMRTTAPSLRLLDKGRLFKSHSLKPSHLHLTHSLGITLDHFQKNQTLHSQFRVLATSTDRSKGKTEYVIAMEGRTLPFYGVQFHPEMTSTLDWMADFFKKEMGPASQKRLPLPHTFSLTVDRLRPCPSVWDEYHGARGNKCFVFCGKPSLKI
jgi:GMP synthase-like glutamine amidotransferase